MNTGIITATVKNLGLSAIELRPDKYEEVKSDPGVAKKTARRSRKEPGTPSNSSLWLSRAIKVVRYGCATLALTQVVNAIKVSSKLVGERMVRHVDVKICPSFFAYALMGAQFLAAAEGIDLHAAIAKKLGIDLPAAQGSEGMKVIKRAPFSLEKLDEMPGLKALKEKVQSLRTKSLIDAKREEHGCMVVNSSHHMQLLGNPGTGKTMSATLLTALLYEIGAISENKMTRADRGDLTSWWVNGTEKKVKEVLEKAKGGVLFIDEAYALDSGTNGNEKDGGHKVLEVLLPAMEDPESDVVIIFAGYPEQMKKMISTNPGLASRIGHNIHFEDLNADELVDVFKYICAQGDYTVSDEALARAKQKLLEIKRCFGADFGNARTVKAFFHKVIETQSHRLANKTEDLNAAMLRDISVSDIEDTSLDEFKSGQEQLPPSMYS